MQKVIVDSVKCHSLQGAFPPDLLTRGLAPGHQWVRGLIPRTPVVAVHFGYIFVCGPRLQIRCAPVV